MAEDRDIRTVVGQFRTERFPSFRERTASPPSGSSGGTGIRSVASSTRPANTRQVTAKQVQATGGHAPSAPAPATPGFSPGAVFGVTNASPGRPGQVSALGKSVAQAVSFFVGDSAKNALKRSVPSLLSLSPLALTVPFRMALAAEAATARSALTPAEVSRAQKAVPVLFSPDFKNNDVVNFPTNLAENKFVADSSTPSAGAASNAGLSPAQVSSLMGQPSFTSRGISIGKKGATSSPGARGSGSSPGGATAAGVSASGGAGSSTAAGAGASQGRGRSRGATSATGGSGAGAGGSAGGCFLTTAICRNSDKPDDCYELRVMRWLRDNVLAAQPGGKDEIQEYYEVAPMIISRLRDLGVARDVFNWLRTEHINPIIRLYEEHRFDECLERYRLMVRQLRAMVGV